MRYAFPVETTELCSYGCGCQAKYKNKSGNLMCLDNSSKCPINRKKNSSGLINAYKNGTRIPASCVYENLSEETKKKMNWNKGIFTETSFGYGETGNHKGLLISIRGHRCECCGLIEWMGNPITIELEHSDGDRLNNTEENLKLLCPNCHSYTETWRGKNIKNKKRKEQISDEDFKFALKNSKNIRQALLKLGLTPKGGNYQRANELLLEIE